MNKNAQRLGTLGAKTMLSDKNQMNEQFFVVIASGTIDVFCVHWRLLFAITIEMKSREKDERLFSSFVVKGIKQNEKKKYIIKYGWNVYRKQNIYSWCVLLNM